MGFERSEEEGPKSVSFADFIQGLDAKSNLKVRVSGPELVIVPYDMGEGRAQNTFVRPLGKTGAGHLIVSFFSPALKMPAGQEIGAKTANDLLRRNSKIPHGAWAIDQVDGADYLGVFETHIAQTMDPAEFAAACFVTAKLADDMEKTMGADSF
ncbi:MAG: hypothetical protein HYV15_06970 [Elusimicrobia bacterium]|nr:hypothetical protein [Elusimicrobiota bacterium]